ncbi:MAG: thiamine pyrophosphate-dependent enzyme [Raoultibacter sp.]
MLLLSGNEAIAQGAWEAGAHIGVAYPGTPSTETMEAFAEKEGVYAEWCTNEKVALEVGLGASAAGARVLVTMKHVGVNVAADPLFTSSYTGVGGGLLIMAADDPGMHSSQNEQDSRFYALAARVPILEPSDSAEALEFTRAAFAASERFDTPWLIRSTVRISHTKTLVEVGERHEQPLKEYKSDAAKWVMMPAFAKPRRTVLDARVDDLRAWVETCPFNTLEAQSSAVGIICSGAVYHYVKEALPEASVFKLGVTWPLPAGALHDFAASVQDVYVIEEASDYLSTQIKALGIALSTPCGTPLPRAGELTPQAIQCAFGATLPDHASAPTDVPGRPPALCPGCPHRLVFKELKRMRAIVTGDIGCYTLGALPPLCGMDTCVDMGASISMAHGFELALQGTEHRPIVGIIGDSTFAHSGLSSLISTAYNKGGGTVAILDNRTTAMTGRQGNPFNGETLQKRPSREMGIERIVEALGISDVQTVDPHDAKAVRAALKAACASADLSVIVFRAPCVLIDRIKQPHFEVNASCTACGVCISLGCPALSCDPLTGQAAIDATLCIGCGQCAQYCNFGAIVRPDACTKEVSHV